MKFDFSENDSTVAMSGDLTFTDHNAFLSLMNRLLGSSGGPVVIDLSRLEFINSAGLGMLLIARDEAGKNHRQITLRGPKAQVERMFAATRFATLFVIET